MMASNLEATTQKVDERCKSKSNLAITARQAQNLFKSKSFYDQMDFDSDQRLAIAKIIIKLIDMSKGSDSEFSKKPLHKRVK